MIKNTLYSLALIWSLLTASSVFAHGAGPHGGTLIDIAPYHAEFEVAQGMIHIYVIDENNKVLASSDVPGKLILQKSDGTKKDFTLSPMGDALMAATDVGSTDTFVALATLTIKGKTYMARYSHVPSAKTDTTSKSGDAVTSEKKLKGKLVDISCYLTHDSSSPAHKACAKDCALKGLPMGILAEDGLIYQIIPIGHLEPKKTNETLIDYLEEQVVIEGIVSEKNGMRVVMISKISHAEKQ